MQIKWPNVCYCDPVVLHTRGEKGCLHATKETIEQRERERIERETRQSEAIENCNQP